MMYRGKKVAECFKSSPISQVTVIKIGVIGGIMYGELDSTKERILVAKNEEQYFHPIEMCMSDLVWFKYLEDDSGLHCACEKEFYGN